MRASSLEIRILQMKPKRLIKLSRKEVSIMGGWNSEAEHTQADYDNHADQMNPNNDEYYHSRGED